MKPFLQKRRFISVLDILALFLVTATFLTTSVTEHNWGYDEDGRHYAAMAGEVSFPKEMKHEAPYCYRVLSPFLVSLLPGTTLQGFQILMFVSNLLSLMVLSRILDFYGFSIGYQGMGMLLYAGSFWTLKFSFYSPAYIDAPTQLMLLLVIYLTIHRCWGLVVLVLALGVMQKESLAVISLFSTSHLVRVQTGRIGEREAGWLAGMLLIPWLVWGGLRMMIPAENTHNLGIVMVNLARLDDLEFWVIGLHALLSALGMIPVILLMTRGGWTGFLKEHWEWGIYGILAIGLLFGGSDKGRLFLYLLPLTVLLALKGLEFLEERDEPRRWVRGLIGLLGTKGVMGMKNNRRLYFPWLVLLLVGIHGIVGGYFGPMGSYGEYLARWVPEHSKGEFFDPYFFDLLDWNLVGWVGIGLYRQSTEKKG